MTRAPVAEAATSVVAVEDSVVDPAAATSVVAVEADSAVDPAVARRAAAAVA